jgi:soluble lytic murein transglycosylase-like protein
MALPSGLERPTPLAPEAAQYAAAGQPLAVTSDPAFDRLVEEAATEHQVDALLVHAIIRVESGYNRYALSHKGAEGLMQLIPGTAHSLGVRNSFDTRQNVRGGVKYLRQMIDRFSDVRHALAAYNAGPQAVERWGGTPPYAETRDYVRNVGGQYEELRRRHGSSPEQATPAEASGPVYAPVEAFLDEQGRLHMRTK